MKKLIINIFLAFLAITLLSLLLVPALLTAIVRILIKNGFKKGVLILSKYFLNIAVAIDANGNVICSQLFNWLLISNDGYPFGNPDETISGVIGKNKISSTLIKLGKWLDSVLEKIESNHSIKSIEEDENFTFRSKT